jgi:hypothetical protein
MCVSCGCGKPNDDHGDSRHITMSQIEAAADAAGISIDDVAENILEATAEGAAGEGEQ